jgi:hypothetical protein
VACAVAGLLAIPRAPAAAQAACRGPSTTSALLVHEVKRYVFATRGDDALVRDSLGLRPNPPTLQVVQDEAVCQAASLAYRRGLDRNLDTVSGRVIVLQAADRYIVWDPAYRYDLSLPYAPRFVVIMDTAFRRLSLF